MYSDLFRKIYFKMSKLTHLMMYLFKARLSYMLALVDLK